MDEIQQALTGSEMRQRLWRAMSERDRLRAELAEQKAANIALAERLAACSAVLSRAAERGKVCGCQEAEKDKTSFGLPGSQ